MTDETSNIVGGSVPPTIAIEYPDGELHGNGDIIASAAAYRNPLYYALKQIPMPGKQRHQKVIAQK